MIFSLFLLFRRMLSTFLFIYLFIYLYTCLITFFFVCFFFCYSLCFLVFLLACFYLFFVAIFAPLLHFMILFVFRFFKVFEVTDKLFVGLTGLASDVLTLDHTLKMHCNTYKLRENREIKPETFSALLSTLLYEKRYFFTLINFNLTYCSIFYIFVIYSILFYFIL